MIPESLTELFNSHAVDLAPALLGCELTVTTERGSVRVRLSEVEAYGGQGEDPGAHSYNGKTPRNASLFGPPRHIYVYLNYGIHKCVNLACNAEGTAGGVLLRSAEVIAGRELAAQRRGGKDTGVKLLSGPGRLGQGLGITLPMDGAPLSIADSDRWHSPERNTEEVSFVLAKPQASPSPSQIRSGPRVGVSGVGGSDAYPWRFWIDGDPTVSAFRRGKNVPVMSGEAQNHSGTPD